MSRTARSRNTAELLVDRWLQTFECTWAQDAQSWDVATAWDPTSPSKLQCIVETKTACISNRAKLNALQLQVARAVFWQFSSFTFSLFLQQSSVKINGTRKMTTERHKSGAINCLLWKNNSCSEWLIDWLEFNSTFSTVRLYRAFRSYSLQFGK